MNKADMVSKLRDSTEAMRLAPSEVSHMIDMMADWGWLTLDDEPQPANAAIEGADAEPLVHEAEDYEYDDSDDDDDDEETESESEHRELVTPRVHRTKVKTKTKTKATSTRRSHR